MSVLNLSADDSAVSLSEAWLPVLGQIKTPETLQSDCEDGSCVSLLRSTFKKKCFPLPLVRLAPFFSLRRLLFPAAAPLKCRTLRAALWPPVGSRVLKIRGQSRVIGMPWGIKEMQELWVQLNKPRRRRKLVRKRCTVASYQITKAC